MKLKRSFYNRDVLEVARDLLGKVLYHRTPEGITAGRIVETEAYKGPHDSAAHSYGNRRTERTEVMFGPAGYAYVYFIYGMYYNFNVICNKRDCPEGVLIRALEPLSGIELMQKRRKTEIFKNLCSGPGKLCMAMGIDRSCYGLDLCGKQIWLEDGAMPDAEVISAPRVNIDYAGEAKNYPWRYLFCGHPCVSVKPKN